MRSLGILKERVPGVRVLGGVVGVGEDDETLDVVADAVCVAVNALDRLLACLAWVRWERNSGDSEVNVEVWSEEKRKAALAVAEREGASVAADDCVG
jgi:hypothetical protein